MKRMLASVDLIIECRDYRVPLTSRNPLFEETLRGKRRVVVYTKRDLGVEDVGSGAVKQVRFLCLILSFYLSQGMDGWS